MRTSPCWTRLHHRFSQVATHLQLSYHVTLGFSRHVVNVSIITSSYDVERAPDRPWINLCDHDKVLRHLFWANLVMYRVGP
ncbi:hypothetical protein BDA96_10G153400 [Sorghum bicolor]|uniref:Uncharacterized protein n=1 Tax=Sorghum bicolor TaxID=4558 RepID=A0A921Q334_SORBI|nr:hypothetical protein BDA96_10G153400 [Sorghum bicolor]